MRAKPVAEGVFRRYGRLGALLCLLLLLPALLVACGPRAPRADARPAPQSPLAESFLPVPAAPSGQAAGVFRFIAFGDSGSGAPFQYDLAAEMARKSADPGFSMVLMLGDNIYERGDVTDLGDKCFRKPYAPLLAKQIPFVVTLGNHDVIGGFETDQIAYFKMPGEYYRVVPQGVSPERLEIFVINSNNFARHPNQQAWLKAALAESKAAWKVVMAHHPLYTSGEHQNDGDLKLLRTVLAPILSEGGADLYLAGHDHDYERFEPQGGVTQIVSGGGGAYLRNFKVIQPHSLVRHKAHHFLLFTLDAAGLHFQTIDKTGAVLDEGDIAPNPGVAKRPAAA
ncbi:MAG: metallophosphoesterase [Candidatus Melainabacteria bacterium]